MLNPVFGFLALIGLLLTIVLQSRELRNSTSELRKSSIALSLQNESLRKQNFESAFFSLLRFHNDIIRDIDIRGATADASGLTVGRDCFKVFYKRLRKRFDAYDAEDPKQRLTQAYLIFFEENQADLGHYFRHLYHIFKFVNESEIENPKYYASLVRAQLSTNELLLLFYNCVSPKGTDKFMPFVEQYALLKNMPTNELLNSVHSEYCEKSAFGIEAGRPDTSLTL